MTDYYEILGIPKNATQEQIKKAYRRLAHKYHPDKSASHADGVQFKQINEAYQILSDPIKRSQYDQFGSYDYEQREGGFGAGQSYQTGSGFSYYSEGNSAYNFGFGNLKDIFEDFFSSAFSDIQLELPITVSQAVLGGDIRFQTKLGERIDLKIPSGVQDGQTIRIKNGGLRYKRGRGNLLVSIKIKIPTKITKEQKKIFEELRKEGI